MHRRCVPGENRGPGDLPFAPDDARHILRALRLATGDRCIAVAPDGCEYTVELSEVAGGGVRGRILSRRQGTGAPGLR